MYHINVELAISDLEIFSSDVAEINLHIKRSRNGDLISLPPSIEIQEDDTGLVVKEAFEKDWLNLKEIGKFITGENKSVYMVIEIPRDLEISDTLISLKTGNLRLNNFKCKTMQIKALAGDVKGSDVQIKNLQASLAAGDIKLKGIFKELDVDLKAGDVKLSPSSHAQTININCAVGDVKLELPNVSEYAVFTSLGLGELKLKRFDGKVTFDQASEKKIYVKSKAGDLKIYHSF